MNAKSYLALLAVVCIIAVVSAQTSSANPIESLQGKASSVAASATNTSPAAASNTDTSAGFSLNSGLSQLLVLGCAFVVSSLLA